MAQKSPSRCLQKDATVAVAVAVALPKVRLVVLVIVVIIVMVNRKKEFGWRFQVSARANGLETTGEKLGFQADTLLLNECRLCWAVEEEKKEVTEHHQQPSAGVLAGGANPCQPLPTLAGQGTLVHINDTLPDWNCFP